MTETGTRLAAAAVRILSRLGINCVYDHSVITPDESAGTATSSATTSTIICAPLQKYKAFFVNDTTIQQDDTFTYIAAQSFTPKKGDSLTVIGIKWAVVRVEPLHGDETVAAYKLQLRQ